MHRKCIGNSKENLRPDAKVYNVNGFVFSKRLSKISKRSSLRTEIRVQLNLDPSSVQPQEAGIDFDEFW